MAAASKVPNAFMPRPVSGRGGAVGKLTAEFIIAFSFAVIALFFFNTSNSDIDETHFVLRATGVCGIFFVLALAANSRKMSKPVVVFGALIDFAMLLHITATYAQSKSSKKNTAVST